MILVFSLVFAFLWGYLKQFPRGNRLKMILTVTVFSILASFLVAIMSMYGFFDAYGTDMNILCAPYNPILAQFSLPFHLEVKWGYIELIQNTGPVWFKIFFAGMELSEMRFSYRATAGRIHIFQSGQIDGNYINQMFHQLLVIFTAFNLLGAPLAAFAYVCMLRIWKYMKKPMTTVYTIGYSQINFLNLVNLLLKWLEFPHHNKVHSFA